MTTVVSAKRCTRCKTAKPFDSYYRAKNSADGRKSWCKTCCDKHSKSMRAVRRENAEADATAAQVHAYQAAVDAYYAEPEPVYSAAAHSEGGRRMTDWRAHARCSDADPELWHAVGRDAEAREETRIAKKVCAGCPSRIPCAQWAIDHGEQGVWGGLDDAERRALKKDQERARATA